MKQDNITQTIIIKRKGGVYSIKGNRHKELIVLREKLTPEEEAELKEEQAFIDSIC